MNKRVFGHVASAGAGAVVAVILATAGVLSAASTSDSASSKPTMEVLPSATGLKYSQTVEIKAHHLPKGSGTVAATICGLQDASGKKIAKPTLVAAGNTPGTPRKKTIAAGPQAATARRGRVAEPSALEQLQTVIVGSLEDDKAEAIVTLDLAGKASFCDRMVIATGLADRQIAAMAEHLSEKLHKAGLKRVQVEGAGGADWVLIDAGDIVVHLFKPEARAMYALEKMWGAELDEVSTG